MIHTRTMVSEPFGFAFAVSPGEGRYVSNLDRIIVTYKTVRSTGHTLSAIVFQFNLLTSAVRSMGSFVLLHKRMRDVKM